MLPPFKIANLHSDALDLSAWSCTIQISAQQYDQELKEVPEAILSYLDIDDGDVITVSTSLRLAQGPWSG